MHGIGLDEDVRRWFAGKVPRSRVPPRFIERALSQPSHPSPRKPA